MAIATSIQDVTSRHSPPGESSKQKACNREIVPCCVECKYNESCCETNVSRDGVRYFTMCQVRRHNNINSAWLLVGDKIYDATEYLHIHPGGKTSILRKAGGAYDCSEDFRFHSKSGRRLWQKFFIGKLRPCAGSPEDRQWWQFWM
eukprot:scaffold443_cov125-Cylindrotheca_fusiformis.AAC.44